MNTPFIIAEIAQAHNGSLQKAFDYIKALEGTGIDAVKFQTHIAVAESSIHEPFRVKFSDQDATRFDYWERMEFTKAQWIQIKERTEAAGFEFMSSPFSNAAVDLLEDIGIQRYKIGSGEVNNFLLLEKIVATGKPLIVSSGMSSFKELDATVAFLREQQASFSIMQCTTSYPTKPEDYGLNVINQMIERYQVPIGYSDHSADIGTCIAATALGASLLEFHAVFNHTDFGPDATSSIEIKDIPQLVQSVHNIYKANQSPINKEDNSKFSTLKSIFEKSLAVNKDLPKGHMLSFEDLEAKKPKGYGMDAANFTEVLGKKINKPLSKWSFLTNEDVMQ